MYLKINNFWKENLKKKKKIKKIEKNEKKIY